MNNKNDTSKKRSHVIERFIDIDGLISVMISHAELGYVDIGYVQNELHKSGMNSHNRIEKLKGILIKLKIDDIEFIDKLHRMRDIRNNFAHCWAIIKTKEGEEFIFNPKDWNTKIDLDVEFKEFENLDKQINDVLLKIYRDSLKGILFKKIPEKS